MVLMEELMNQLLINTLKERKIVIFDVPGVLVPT